MIIEQKFSDLATMPQATFAAGTDKTFFPVIFKNGGGVSNFVLSAEDLIDTVRSMLNITTLTITVTTHTNTIMDASLINKALLFVSVGMTQTADFTFDPVTGTLDFTAIGGLEDTTVFIISVQ